MPRRRIVSTAPEPRSALCLLCSHEMFIVRFPASCTLCGAHGSWLIGTPEPFLKRERTLDRLRRDPRVIARSTSARGVTGCPPVSALPTPTVSALCG